MISSFCAANQCVDVSFVEGKVYVKHSEGHIAIEFTKEEWDAFVMGVKAGEFNAST